jgi:hypothetical protein
VNRFVAVVAALLVGALPAFAQERVGKVTDVRQAEVGTTVLVDQGTDEGVAQGQTIEVRRDGKVIGYGSVDTVFKDLAVCSVGTIVTGASPLKVGDDVAFRGQGFTRPGATAPAPATPDPAAVALPKGKILSARDGVVLLEFGVGEPQAEVGMEVSVLGADGAERGRLVLELVNGRTAAGGLLSGEAKADDQAAVVSRARNEGPIDYVALSFLGVVADLEHPTPHRAPCHVGVPVRRVMPASPAQRAGIGRGDRVMAVDGIVVRDVSAIRERIEARQGDRVAVVLLRGDRVLSVDVIFR